MNKEERQYFPPLFVIFTVPQTPINAQNKPTLYF